MHTSKVLVKTGQGKIFSGGWQTKGLDLEWQKDPLTDQFHISLFSI